MSIETPAGKPVKKCDVDNCDMKPLLKVASARLFMTPFHFSYFSLLRYV